MTYVKNMVVGFVVLLISAIAWGQGYAAGPFPEQAPPPAVKVPIPIAQCGYRTTVAAWLKSEHGEEPRWAGISGSGITEIWTTEDGHSSFTITFSSQPKGSAVWACMISSGTKLINVSDMFFKGPEL